MNYEQRHTEAQEYYQSGLRRVRTTPPPIQQKYEPGTRVRIADDLGPCMAHFHSACNGTVRYTYAHIFGGGDVKSYCIDIDGHGESSWYHEHQLTKLAEVAA